MLREAFKGMAADYGYTRVARGCRWFGWSSAGFDCCYCAVSGHGLLVRRGVITSGGIYTHVDEACE